MTPVLSVFALGMWGEQTPLLKPQKGSGHRALLWPAQLAPPRYGLIIALGIGLLGAGLPLINLFRSWL